jgi:uncharacterized protein YeeX (DUF496 family)
MTTMNCYVRYGPYYKISTLDFNLDLNLNLDLNIESVTDIIKKMAQNHERRLHNQPNTEAMQLLNYREATRRLNRTKPMELC